MPVVPYLETAFVKKKKTKKNPPKKKAKKKRAVKKKSYLPKKYQIPRYELRLKRQGGIFVEDTELKSPHDLYLLSQEVAADVDREVLYVVALDPAFNIIGINLVSIGTLDSAIANPKDVVKMVVMLNAYGFAMFHVHPSGQLEPSPQDLKLTRNLRVISDMMGFHMLDHLTVSDKGYFPIMSAMGEDIMYIEYETDEGTQKYFELLDEKFIPLDPEGEIMQEYRERVKRRAEDMMERLKEQAEAAEGMQGLMDLLKGAMGE
jgi:DNA repair protein RadC